MPKDIKKKILNATLEVIAREKISGTRMHLIAKEAGIVQSNLHYYYPTKNDLLVALLNDIQEWFSEKRRKGIDLENKLFLENLHTIFAEKQDVIRNNKKLDSVQFDYWVQGTVDPDVGETFRKMFDIWRGDIGKVLAQREGLNKADSKTAKMIPFIMVSLMMGASMQYQIDVEKFSLDDYFAIAEKTVLNMLDEMANKEEDTK